MSEPYAKARHPIILAARAFARLGYIHGFGHVSIRTEDGLLITPTRPPFLAQKPDDLLHCDHSAAVRDGDEKARPIEVFLHLGIYQARPDVHAICRTHAPSASAIQTERSVPPIQHGFGGIVGRVSVFNETDLIHNQQMGKHAAECLGSADALVLRGNGVLTVGATIGQAATRMWSLEERCAFARLTPDEETAFSDRELKARRRWYDAESDRIWTWLQHLGEA
jgi:HCOMODA/2-hydroxy-3-carboxy-muconic semialdehyde decarboxylase